jgi:hypothetical protein
VLKPLSPALDKKIKEVFTLMDLDGNGTVDLPEFRQFFIECGKKDQASRISNFMNGAPTFDCDEFTKYWRAELGVGASEDCLLNIMSGMVTSGSQAREAAKRKLSQSSQSDLSRQSQNMMLQISALSSKNSKKNDNRQ